MSKRSMQKTKMREQEPNLRIKNFFEVSLGYTFEEATLEAQRCLECKKRPCTLGCPVNIKIPEFIHEIKNGNIEKAYEIITEDNGLPAICGRVCPQEKQCEERCVYGIKGEAVGIGRLERFVADYVIELGKSSPVCIETNGKKVAIVGSGPASLSCASDLVKLGYSVTIFEALHELGGVLMYGIPEFRLPKDLVAKEIKRIIDLGVNVEKNVIVGKSIDIEELIEEGYEAIFIGSGAGLPKFMAIPGENLNGVYSSNEFLTRVNLMKAYDWPNYHTPIKLGGRVAVIGGGNVAMDAARTAKRIGADEVHIIYRRGIEELPARKEEVHHALEEGIIFDILTNPIEIIGENSEVIGLKFIKMELGEPDASGRRSPIEVKHSEYTLDIDNVVIAIGQNPNPLLTTTTSQLKTNKRGCIMVDETTLETTMKNVYAGGDAVTGAATVILAMGAGRKAAANIHESLNV